MKNVIIFTKNICEYGGIERFVCSLANMLKDDFRVKILSVYGTKNQNIHFNLDNKIEVDFLIDKIPDEVSMMRLIKRRKIVNILNEINRRINISNEINEKTKKYFKNNIPDILISDRAITNKLAGKLLPRTVRLIATDHNFHQNNRRYISQLRNSLRNYDTLITPTKELNNFYKKKISNVRCIQIPNTIDYIPKTKATFNEPVIITVGRLRPEKDFDSFIDVIERIKLEIPNANALIVGEGPEHNHLKTQIQKKGLETTIKLVGGKENSEVMKLLQHSSIYLMTSKTEAFGIAILEALAAGIPIIAFDRASGARNIIKHGKTGFLIKNSDAQEMTVKAIELLQNRKELLRLQGYINKDINNYSFETIKKQWLKALGK